MHKPANDFKTLCWYAGFVHIVNAQIQLDKRRLCDYLHCSRRTLERWLSLNKPCPRAKALIIQKRGALDDKWTDFTVDRDNKLYHVTWARGFSIDIVAQLPQLLQQRYDYKLENEQLKRHFDTLRDPSASIAQRSALLSIAEQLGRLANDSIYYDVKKGWAKPGA